MSFSTNVREAANRHDTAARTLDEKNQRAGAAYLFGLAAECAVKAILERCGVRPVQPRREDPFFAHFPELKKLLEDRVEGRGATALKPFVTKDFMADWDIVLRYAPKSEIVGSAAYDRRYERWKEDAQRALNTMGEYT
jgi:hypothetical protein